MFSRMIEMSPSRAATTTRFPRCNSRAVASFRPRNSSTNFARPSAGRRRHWKAELAEIFSPPRVTVEGARRGMQLTSPAAFGLDTGWNVYLPGHREYLTRELDKQLPASVILSPECRVFLAM